MLIQHGASSEREARSLSGVSPTCEHSLFTSTTKKTDEQIKAPTPVATRARAVSLHCSNNTSQTNKEILLGVVVVRPNSHHRVQVGFRAKREERTGCIHACIYICVRTLAYLRACNRHLCEGNDGNESQMEDMSLALSGFICRIASER